MSRVITRIQKKSPNINIYDIYYYTYTLPDGRATTWRIQDGGTMHADESNKHARRITTS